MYGRHPASVQSSPVSLPGFFRMPSGTPTVVGGVPVLFLDGHGYLEQVGEFAAHQVEGWPGTDA
ncbi:MAG: hypothetical protein JWN15_2860 [Firmicutes bacterium]|nr:hypothetical protein [Bacillota bacterium]